MDRSTNGLRFDGPTSLPPGFDLQAQTPLDRATAIAALVQADDLLEQNEPEYALPLYYRATTTEARDVAAAGYYGLGNVLYRMDREAEARASWEQATSIGENAPVAYRAWRQVAAARVRDGDLKGAVEAYRRCERLAPQEDRAEIASRLGWLSKETGNSGAAQKYFARSRGDAMPPFMTYLIIAVTVVTSLMATSSPSLLERLEMAPLLVARGEYFRLLTVTLVHDPSNYLHLIFNMYALWYAGQLVERMYGSSRLLFFYLLCAASGSAASYAFGLPIMGTGVGASGAIFGLFGIVLVSTRLHHAILDARSRAIASQVGVLIVLNLFIGLSGIMRVDNFAHVGGLLGGLWLALILPPTHVQTLSSVWQRPQGASSPGGLAAIRIAGVLAMIVVVGAVVAYGTINAQESPVYKYYSVESGEIVAPAEAIEDSIHVAPVEARAIGRPDDGVALQG
jgi:membrane associated rhomboid family serine protease